MRFLICILAFFASSVVLVYASGSETFETCQYPSASRFIMQFYDTQYRVRPLIERRPSPSTMDEYLNQFIHPRQVEIFGYRTEHSRWQYADVSGDGEDDLILSGYISGGGTFVNVLVWMDNHYCAPYMTSTYALGGGAVTLEDWTNDDIPDLIFDTRSYGHSSVDSYSLTWSTTVVTCQNENCRTILNLPRIFHYSQDSSGRTSTISTDFERSNMSGIPSIHTRSEGFRLGSPAYDTTPLVIYPTTDRTYQWNGTTFEITQENGAWSGAVTNSMQILTATSTTGVNAAIMLESNDDYSPYGMPFGTMRCHLFIGEQEFFAPLCYDRFVQVQWQDVTNDGEEELLFSTMGGLQKGQNCIHRNVTIIQLIDGDPTRLGVLSGCIIQANLYGVRVEDIDGDGQVELIAAKRLIDGEQSEVESPNRPWPIQLETVYRFNGTQFVQAETIPRDPR